MDTLDNSCSKHIKPPVSVILLTYNEEKNIEESLRSIYGWCKEIFIVDSYSTDRTLEIAKKYTDKIYQHPFDNQAKQLNWALNTLPITTDWIMKLDADEMVMDGLKAELIEKLPKLDNRVVGLYVKRRVYFLGKWIKHGGYYPTWLLRIWRNGKGCSEERWMDEHIKVSDGEISLLDNDILEYNHNHLHWWIEKHNKYATREAIDILNLKYKLFECVTIAGSLSGTQEQKKRWLKENLYLRLPLFVRPFYYFVYRYVVKLGFLDGKEGLVWHFLQGFWYRFLVDSKIYEMEKKKRAGEKGMREIIGELYQIKI